MKKRRTGCAQRGNNTSKDLEVKAAMFGDTATRLSSLEVEINIGDGG